jgi:hypothetical protein
MENNEQQSKRDLSGISVPRICLSGQWLVGERGRANDVKCQLNQCENGKYASELVEYNTSLVVRELGQYPDLTTC